MADDILKNIPLPADLPENWRSDQTVAPTGAEVGMDEQHGYNYLMRQVNNAQKAATALNEGKLGLHDTADNSQKLDGYELRLSDHPGSANILVQTVDEDGRTCIDCRNDASIGLTAIVASGAGYVRFGDGTQICWGETEQIAVKANSTVTATITYPAAFVSGHTPEVSLTIAGNSKNDNYSKLVLHTTIRLTTSCDIYFKNSSSSQIAPIAQWIAIGRWK